MKTLFNPPHQQSHFPEEEPEQIALIQASAPDPQKTILKKEDIEAVLRKSGFSRQGQGKEMGVLHQGLEFVDSGEEDTAAAAAAASSSLLSSPSTSAQQLARMEKNSPPSFLAKSRNVARIGLKISCFRMGFCVIGLIVIIVMAETPGV